MSNSVTLLQKLKRIDAVNDERLSQIAIKNQRLDEYLAYLDKLRHSYQTAKFTSDKLSEYYVHERERNLKHLAELVGEFMAGIFQKPYDVQLKIERRGNYDYLDKTVNGIQPELLSGGEKQLFSLALVSETISNGVAVFDETINSLHSSVLDRVLEYLDILSNGKQVFLIELDENLNVPIKFVAENNTIRRV